MECAKVLFVLNMLKLQMNYCCTSKDYFYEKAIYYLIIISLYYIENEP